jgi:hypothetical protein
MYKITGADGKEYGPVSIERLREWVGQGRVNAKTLVQAAGSADWQPAAEVPDLASLFASPMARQVGDGAPPLLAASKFKSQDRGLAILSFVLGLASFVLCLSALTGLPAILFGHIARRRAARLPVRYGGAGLAMAGLILGYLNLVFSLFIAGVILPALARSTQTTHNTQTVQRADCQNNLRQIGLAFKVWALEHNDQYPFNVSTNAGGTLELCAAGADGFDNNAVAHFLIIANELTTPSFLVCPKDRSKRVASDFTDFKGVNLSYRLRTGTNINGDNPQEILAVCPIDGNELFCDGNVRKSARPGAQ